MSDVNAVHDEMLVTENQRQDEQNIWVGALCNLESLIALFNININYFLLLSGFYLIFYVNIGCVYTFKH